MAMASQRSVTFAGSSPSRSSRSSTPARSPQLARSMSYSGGTRWRGETASGGRSLIGSTMMGGGHGGGHTMSAAEKSGRLFLGLGLRLSLDQQAPMVQKDHGLVPYLKAVRDAEVVCSRTAETAARDSDPVRSLLEKDAKLPLPEAKAAMREAWLDGHLETFREAVRQAKNAGGIKDPDVEHATAALECALRCVAECEEILASPGSKRLVNLPLATLGLLRLGPRIWETEILRKARARLVAYRLVDEARSAAGCGRTEDRRRNAIVWEHTWRCQRERAADLIPWLRTHFPHLKMPEDACKEEVEEEEPIGKKQPPAPENVFGVCGGINLGPNCNGRCKHCFQRHMWLCHGCCCVQYSTHQPWVSQEGNAGRAAYKEANESFMEPCVNGCDWRKYGWTCIASGCPGEEGGCLCKKPAQYWRENGCIRPQNVEDDSELRVENLTLKEFATICERQGDFAWNRKLPPTQVMQARIDELCEVHNVSKTGNYSCQLSRINWRAMQKGDADGVTCRPIVPPPDELTPFLEWMTPP
eukprot:TRINITY_DN24875_c0_g2_i1.p1 TRINITY_DN24875_c0_g2~~TRINITY_DN24875_c0_g2_i1.p1  ORF type:complete len:529 (+),score=115.14 TRINITY_DN24875_c0_g2_i1:103-1689(+)